MLLPDLMNRRSQVSNTGPLGPLVCLLFSNGEIAITAMAAILKIELLFLAHLSGRLNVRYCDLSSSCVCRASVIRRPLSVNFSLNDISS